MKKNISISLLAVLGLCGVAFAQEDYQGQLSDKKLQSMGILTSGSSSKGSLARSKESSDYDQEYEDLLKSIHTLDNNNYELDSKLLDADLTHYEDDYDDLLSKASEILGEEKVATLTNRIEDTVFEKDGRYGDIEISGNLDDNNVNNSSRKAYNIHLKNTSEIIHDYFYIILNNLVF